MALQMVKQKREDDHVTAVRWIPLFVNFMQQNVPNFFMKQEARSRQGDQIEEDEEDWVVSCINNLFSIKEAASSSTRTLPRWWIFVGLSEALSSKEPWEESGIVIMNIS